MDVVVVNADVRIACMLRCFRSALCRAKRLPGGGVAEVMVLLRGPLAAAASTFCDDCPGFNFGALTDTLR